MDVPRSQDLPNTVSCRRRTSRSGWPKWGIVVVSLLSVLMLPAAAFADSVLVKIQTLSATTGDGETDVELKPLEDELRSGFPGYDTFHFLNKTKLNVPVDEKRSLELPDDEKSTLEVTNRGLTKETPALIRLEVGLKGKIAAEVKASPGSTFFQAGLLHKGGILILAISAEIVD